MTVVVLDEAETELNEAQDYYEAARPGLGDAFLDAFERAIARILRHPRAYPVVEDDVRRCLLSGFPYALLYVPKGDVVHVLAVMPQNREPGYWRTRRTDST